MTSKIAFSDRALPSIGLESSWRFQKDKLKEDFECQTDASLYDFVERETQSGLNTQFIQDEVTSSTLSKLRKGGKGETLLDHFCVLHKEYDEDFWRSTIENGKITVDYEVCTDPSTKLEKENFLEYVRIKVDASTQTVAGKAAAKKSDESDAASGIVDELIDYSSLNTFLRRVMPLLEEELDNNANSKAFDGYELVSVDASDEVTYWRTLNVDLEKKKVVFPDWATAKHFRGRIIHCTVTRNKERLYDIEYEDGARLSGVREEHIRCLDNGDGGRGVIGGKKSSAAAAEEKAAKAQEKKSRLSEGVRVHARVTFKGGVVKFIPGRITKCGRAGTYDVECEGGRMEVGLSLDDILSGLEEGSEVEARRPNKVNLQCTGVSWNATGSTIAVSYGKYGIAGWCDYPGAVCLWNVFGKSFDPNMPDAVLDHSSCIMCVKCHPVLPAVVVGGSFNGEVVVWDMSLPEQLFAVSPISEYSHREPIMGVDWVYHQSSGEYLITSVGADGKVLFWSLSNKLKKPFKGSSLAAGKKGSKSSSTSGSSSRRQFPASYGGTSVSFADGGSTSSSITSWFVVGQEGGAIIRGQTSQVLNSGASLSERSSDDMYPPISRGDKTFTHEPHTGAVNSLDCSPFSRHLFLSGGGDGSVRLFHMLQRQPLRKWDPVPPPGAVGTSGTFSAITGVRFSPVRPALFAAASAEGFLYLFDLASSTSAPISVLEAPANTGSTSAGRQTAGSEREGRSYRAGAQAAGARRVGITGVAFNAKQRDLLAACDYSGRVHIWRLGWSLANRHPAEVKLMEQLGSVADD